jgi:serine protease Do
MKCFLRPYTHFGVAALLVALVAAMPPFVKAQSSRIAQIIEESNPLLLHSSPMGYLGVLVGDVDNDSAPKLKLKDVRGAVITLIDHDAPAAQVGLRVNDVVLEMNGQTIEGAEQFGRILREIPAGRKVSMIISRDGATQTIVVQLVDRKKMESDVWNKLGTNSDVGTQVEGMGILGSGSGDAPLPGGFYMPFIGSSSLKVGALVEPLTSQMADYLGVPNGLMVKQVARKSEAAAAGMKAFDIILKVGTENISTVSDWDRSLRANQGKPVQVTILRGGRQQTLTLQVDSKRKSEMEFDDLFPSDECPLVASVDPDLAQDLSHLLGADESAAQSMREQAEEFRKQADAFRDAFKDQDFKIDQKQLDEMKKQMEEFNRRMQENRELFPPQFQ